jgi:hypothetical protein
MSIFKNMIGTMKGIFHIGGPSGSALKNEVSGISVRNAADDAYDNILVNQADGNNPYHGTNWQDLKDSNVLIQFSFDGSSPPAAGANAGAYGFCHTSGGIYTAGQIYFDDTANLRATKIHVGTQMVTGSAVVGTISLNANGIYAAHSGSAPFTWMLKGDGAPDGAGYLRVIEIPIATDASKSSTTSIPAGASVYSVSTNIATPYDNAAAIEVIVDGSSDLTIQPVDENDPSVSNSYLSEVENGNVDSSTEGAVTVNISNSPSTGSGTVSVYYTLTTLA